MKVIDWTKICQKYKGQWIALADDEETVLGTGKSIEKALKEAKAKGYQKPILFKVPSKIIPYVGYEKL